MTDSIPKFKYRIVIANAAVPIGLNLAGVGQSYDQHDACLKKFETGAQIEIRSGWFKFQSN